MSEKVIIDKRYPLILALKTLDSLKIKLIFASLMPIPFIICGIIAMFFLRADWFKDPFIDSIVLLFTVGQLIALKQYITLYNAASKIRNTIYILKENESEKDLTKLKEILYEKAAPGHVRDLIIRWIDLALQGEPLSFEAIMDNAAIKRYQANDKLISTHININRTTLKLGFLGTLIGLLITFPPMKSAILSLQSSEGEFKFVKDIARAIEGDQYAIFTTLIATGFSIFIELLTIQLLERFTLTLEEANNFLDEWAIAYFRPSLKERGIITSKDRATSLETLVNSKIEENLNKVVKAVDELSKTVDNIVKFQEILNNKVNKLIEYEKDYRSFISSKLNATIKSIGDIDEKTDT